MSKRRKKRKRQRQKTRGDTTKPTRPASPSVPASPGGPQKGLRQIEYQVLLPEGFESRHYGVRRLCHWSKDEIRRMTPDQILAGLRFFGIDVGPNQFLADLKAKGSTDPIVEGWKSQFDIQAPGFDLDFPWMAAEVLANKLAPDLPCLDNLRWNLRAGYKAQDEAACLAADHWMKAWDALKECAPAEIKNFFDAERSVETGCRLDNWIGDFQQVLHEAAFDDDDEDYFELTVRYCREFLDRFPDSGTHCCSLTIRDLADALFALGRADEGEEVFAEMAGTFPDDPWVYVFWGDAYCGAGKWRRPHANKSRARDLYQAALDHPNAKDIDRPDFERRLTGLTGEP